MQMNISIWYKALPSRRAKNEIMLLFEKSYLYAWWHLPKSTFDISLAGQLSL